MNVQNVSGQFINYFINYKLFDDNCFATTAVDALNLHPCLRAVEWYAENYKCMPRFKTTKQNYYCIPKLKMLSLN